MRRVAICSRVTMMLVLVGALLVFPVSSAAAAVVVSGVSKPPEIIITEVQMTGGSAAEEFIELYNLTGEEIDLADTVGGGKSAWKMNFFSSGNVAEGVPDWTRPISSLSLAGSIPAYGYYLLSSSGYEPAGAAVDQYFKPRLTSTGGGLQLVRMQAGSANVHDRIMWSAIEALPEGVWPAPAYGASMQRVPDEDDEYLSEEGLRVKYINQDLITPGDAWLSQEEPEEIIVSLPEIGESGEVVNPDEKGSAVPVVPPSNAGLRPLQITELLPNPAAPARDETDEYIEIFNPNTRDFLLKGYTLEVETSKKRGFTVSSETSVPAQGYLVLSSSETNLPLANSGAVVRLLEPGGRLLDEAEPYEAAKEGLSWAKFGTGWQWSSTLTPGLINVLNGPAAASAVKKTASPAKTAKVKGVSTTKPKKAKTTKAKAAKIKKTKEPKAATATVASITEPEPRAMINTGVLAAVAGLAVLYGAYEYRHDIANRFHQLRHYRAVRSRNGRPAARR